MSACSANTVSFALRSHDVLALFPEASEPVAEAERGGAVVLRLRATMAAVARLTKSLLMYSSMKPAGSAARASNWTPLASFSFLRRRKMTLVLVRSPVEQRRDTATAAAFDCTAMALLVSRGNLGQI